MFWIVYSSSIGQHISCSHATCFITSFPNVHTRTVYTLMRPSRRSGWCGSECKVTTLTTRKPIICISVSGRGKEFMSFKKRPDWHVPKQLPIRRVLKVQGVRGFVHSLLFSVKINEWSYTSSLVYTFMAYIGTFFSVTTLLLSPLPNGIFPSDFILKFCVHFLYSVSLCLPDFITITIKCRNN
jgi:hypothetical protein